MQLLPCLSVFWVAKFGVAVLVEGEQVAIDADGEIYFDGARVESAKDVEWGVRAVLANTVSNDQRHVQFKCDAALPKEVFEPVLKAIAEAGGIIEAVGEKDG